MALKLLVADISEYHNFKDWTLLVFFMGKMSRLWRAIHDFDTR